ncbi:hypothetical protein [Streptomyces sp. NPDC012888]|uniref:hypothetical protein n=1 Tax=Streptomyces sp. NPDC012888 TaxID=3364855 RepID=UPI0036B5EA3B
MKRIRRTRTTALVLASAAAALAPALVGPASAAEGTSYLQDPAGGEKDMKAFRTADKQHKVEGQLRFHPGVVYSMVPRNSAKGDPDWGAQAPDPKTLAWQPKFEFAWAVSDLDPVKKILTLKKGKHPVTLHATLWKADRTKAAEVHSTVQDRPATGSVVLPGSKRIACDTGEYTVEWQLTRTGYGSVGGTLKWDADCAQYRRAFAEGTGGR